MTDLSPHDPSLSEAPAATAEKQAIQKPNKVKLDPFGFLPDHVSAIRPLGGPEIGPDPKYGFHTAYRTFRPGPITFCVNFRALVAKFGELTVHVNGFVPDSGHNAVLANATRIDMAELAANGGQFEISIISVPGVSYAIVGLFYDGTDATAEWLRIHVRESGEQGSWDALDNVPTPFGSTTIEFVHRFISDQPPLFGDPISQPCTRAQLHEPSFKQIAARLYRQRVDPVDLWGEAFLVQALTRYGMLQAGARGLMMAPPRGLLPQLLGSHGCEIVPTMSIDREPLEFASKSGKYDFLFSYGAIESRAGSATAIETLEGAMRYLRPGGLAVHVFDLLIGSIDHFGPDEPRPLIRAEVEQIALTLLARQCDVAQLSFGRDLSEDRPLPRNLYSRSGRAAEIEVTLFGLIARKDLEQ